MKLALRVLLTSLGLATLFNITFVNPALGNAQDKNANPSQLTTHLGGNQANSSPPIVRNTPTEQTQLSSRRLIGLGLNVQNREQLRQVFPALSPKELRATWPELTLRNSEFYNFSQLSNPDSFAFGEAPVHNYQFSHSHLVLSPSNHVDMRVRPDPFTPDSWAIEVLPQASF